MARLSFCLTSVLRQCKPKFRKGIGAVTLKIENFNKFSMAKFQFVRGYLVSRARVSKKSLGRQTMLFRWVRLMSFKACCNRCSKFRSQKSNILYRHVSHFELLKTPHPLKEFESTTVWKPVELSLGSFSYYVILEVEGHFLST